MSIIKDVLVGIKLRLATEDKWVKGNSYLGAKGEPLVWSDVESHPEIVSCTCLMGAKDIVESSLGVRPGDHNSLEVTRHMANCLSDEDSCVVAFNDNKATTFQDVHTFLDKCIESAPE